MTLVLPYETEALCRAVPPHLLEGLRRYAVDRIPTGGFLRACLENDLLCAVARTEEVAYLRSVVMWIHHCAPSQCHGSPAKVQAWLDHEGACVRGLPASGSVEEALNVRR